LSVVRLGDGPQPPVFHRALKTLLSHAYRARGRVAGQGPRDVSVEEVTDPRIEGPQDAIVRITTANICGSDLHPYEGRAPLDAGMVLGHENMGIVEETGPGVDRISAGDRVSVPFNIACGTCRNCVAGWTCACLRANPSGRPTAGYGYPAVGPYRGGQAEYLRVPWADFNLLKLPAGTGHENDFTMLSDIFPTGYHGTELAGVSPGDTVAIFGAGPVGLMAAHSAVLRGAAQVFVVDKARDRLALAERYGATAVNFADADPVEVITDATDGFGVDCGVEAVGYQAHDQAGQEHPRDGAGQARRGCPRHRPHRRSRRVQPGRSRRRHRGRQAGPVRVQLRAGLRQGHQHGPRPVPGQALQPPAARPDYPRQGPPVA